MLLLHTTGQLTSLLANPASWSRNAPPPILADFQGLPLLTEVSDPDSEVQHQCSMKYSRRWYLLTVISSASRSSHHSGDSLIFIHLDLLCFSRFFFSKPILGFME